MPVPRSGPFWRWTFLVLLVAVSASYVWYVGREYPHGGSRMGIAYGVAGSALILLLTFFGVRKRWYRSNFGTLEQWMQSHIYLGLLTLVILTFHTGLRFNDKIAVTAFLLMVLVVMSGAAGAIFYVAVPRLLTEVESNLTVEEISEQLNQLAKSMARVASAKSAPFQRIYTELVRESRPGWLAGWRLIFARHRNRPLQTPGEWSALLGLVEKAEQDDLRQMLVISRQRKELLLRLVYQQRYKNMLEAWLYLHVPATIALILFAVVHIAAVFYYRRIG
jgi:predicted membrane channel-forming protein YqfA (hemolysin III family)